MVLDATLVAILCWAECFDCVGLRALKRISPLAAYTVIVAIGALFALRLFAAVAS